MFWAAGAGSTGRFSVASMAAAIYDANCGVCGDANVDGWLEEECDAGAAANADTPDAPCRADCTLPRCGDGIVDSGEGCDEGAAANSPEGSCGADCQPTGAFGGSRIMTAAMRQSMAEWVEQEGISAPSGWALCYSSPAGDSKADASAFHGPCDPHPRTISVASTHGGSNVCGGPKNMLTVQWQILRHLQKGRF